MENFKSLLNRVDEVRYRSDRISLGSEEFE